MSGMCGLFYFKMPKLKTRRAVAKRIKKTGSGKFKREMAWARHNLTKKSRNRKRRLRQNTLVSPADTKKIRRLLPYA